jgi:hypothetical protein
MKRMAITALLLFAAAGGHAAVEVHMATGFPNTIKKIAVAPLPCHEEVNCQKIEKALNKSVQNHFRSAAVVTTEQINQALFDRSIVEVTKESVIEVAMELGCDAILLPTVVGSEAKDHWNAWTDYKTGEAYMSNVHSVASTVEILIIDPDGKLLMKGQASGDSYLQTDPTYFAESQFDKILRKATK